MNQIDDELRRYFARIKPYYNELFGMAHAITGNYETAEYALQRAIMTNWSKHGGQRGRLGIRERMRMEVRRQSLAEVLSHRGKDAELTWNGLTGDEIEQMEDEDPVMSALSGEDQDLRRMAALKYGCGLKNRERARLMDIPSSQVGTLLGRFEARTRRKLRGQDIRRIDQALTKAIRHEFNRADGTPDTTAVYRTFEAEASGRKAPRHHLSRVIYGVLGAVMLLIIALIFWLAAVLMRAPVMENQEGLAGVAAGIVQMFIL